MRGEKIESNDFLNTTSSADTTIELFRGNSAHEHTYQLFFFLSFLTLVHMNN